MGSNRKLRHEHGIRGLDERMHRLYRRLGSAAKKLGLLCNYDSNLLDEAATWDTFLDTFELPAELTVEGGRIIEELHYRISNILDAYGSIEAEPPGLVDFLHDLINKYR